LKCGTLRRHYRSRILRALEARAFLRYVVDKQWG